MKVHDIVNALESIAPPHLAADWDNVGLLIGDAESNVAHMMLCIDLTDEVLAEAVRAKAKMVMAYHPVIFRPISRITADTESVAYSAAAAGVAVYSMHTALDAAPGGANDVLAEALGLKAVRPLEPTVLSGGYKVVVFVTPQDASHVADAAFDAGAGRIGAYERCAFFSHGVGTFYGGPQTHPSVGVSGRQEAAEELRLELVAPKGRMPAIVEAIRAAHSYETPAIDVYPMDEAPAGAGMGRVGELVRSVTAGTLIGRIKKRLGVAKVLLVGGKGQLVTTAACCTGSAGAMFSSAISAGASFYLTGEMRHHDALAAKAAGLTVACVGHSNSERIALARLVEQLAIMLPKLKVTEAKTDRDPFEIV